MLIGRSPLRMCLGGGGTVLPSYYREHGGFLIAGAINKYVYITLHRTFVPDLIVKYSKLERIAHARDGAALVDGLARVIAYLPTVEERLAFSKLAGSERRWDDAFARFWADGR